MPVKLWIQFHCVSNNCNHTVHCRPSSSRSLPCYLLDCRNWAIKINRWICKWICKHTYRYVYGRQPDSQRVHPLGRSVQLARNGFRCIALSTQFYHSRQSSSPSAFAFLISPSNVIQRNLELSGDFERSKQYHLTSATDHLLRRSPLLLLLWWSYKQKQVRKWKQKCG